MANLFSIKDKVVVTTGGTGVLGKTTAVHLAEGGTKVVILGRKTEVGNEIVKTTCIKGGEALFLAANVLDRNTLEQNLADILKAYGRVDALLNAVGGNIPGATITPVSDAFDLKIDEFQKVVDLNLTGTVLLTQVSLKPMTEQKSGAIVNLSSMVAFRPLTRVAGYSASKAGISNFTAFMATEITKKFGEEVRINAIAPGFSLTEQNRTLLANPDGTYTQRGQDAIRQTPFGRMGRAEELCGTIQYLISDAASFVTGTVAIVNGRFNAFAMQRDLSHASFLPKDKTNRMIKPTFKSKK